MLLSLAFRFQCCKTPNEILLKFSTVKVFIVKFTSRLYTSLCLCVSVCVCVCDLVQGTSSQEHIYTRILVYISVFFFYFLLFIYRCLELLAWHSNIFSYGEFFICLFFVVAVDYLIIVIACYLMPMKPITVFIVFHCIVSLSVIGVYCSHRLSAEFLQVSLIQSN